MGVRRIKLKPAPTVYEMIRKRRRKSGRIRIAAKGQAIGVVPPPPPPPTGPRGPKHQSVRGGRNQTSW
jgi:hypothetical protein